MQVHRGKRLGLSSASSEFQEKIEFGCICRLGFALSSQREFRLPRGLPPMRCHFRPKRKSAVLFFNSARGAAPTLIPEPQSFDLTARGQFPETDIVRAKSTDLGAEAGGLIDSPAKRRNDLPAESPFAREFPRLPNYFHAKFMPYFNRLLDNNAIPIILMDVLNKRFVDLQFRSWHVAQLLHHGIAGSKVVNG